MHQCMSSQQHGRGSTLPTTCSHAPRAHCCRPLRPAPPWLQSRGDLQRLLGGLEREGFDYHGVRIPLGLAPAPAPPQSGGLGSGGAPQVKVLRSPPPGEGAAEWEAWKRGPPGALTNGKDGVPANGGVPRGLTTATLRSSSSSEAGSLGGL